MTPNFGINSVIVFVVLFRSSSTDIEHGKFKVKDL